MIQLPNNFNKYNPSIQAVQKFQDNNFNSQPTVDLKNLFSFNNNAYTTPEFKQSENEYKDKNQFKNLNNLYSPQKFESSNQIINQNTDQAFQNSDSNLNQSSPGVPSPPTIETPTIDPSVVSRRIALEDDKKFKRLNNKHQAEVLEAFDTLDNNTTNGTDTDYSKFSNRQLKVLKRTGDESAGKQLKQNTKDSIVNAGSAVDSKLGSALGGIINGDRAGKIDGYSQMFDFADGLIPKKQQSHATETLNAGYDKASDAVMKVNPVAGVVMKAGGLASDALTAMGVGTDQMTGVDKVMDSKWLKWNVGLVNALGAKKADVINKDDELFSEMGSSYGGSEGDVDKSLEFSGKKYGLFSFGGRRKANRRIREARRQQDMIADISNDAKLDRLTEQSMSDIYANKSQFESQGGFNERMAVGKRGMKLFSKENVRRARQNAMKFNLNNIPEEQIEEDTQLFKNGGKFNVIPEGALHARLNHLDVDNITTKGIPVIAKNGDKIEQQAEVEVNEIIFHKDVTVELEKLWKEGTDEAAIKAGEILVKEILENTEDNTGLIEQIEV